MVVEERRREGFYKVFIVQRSDGEIDRQGGTKASMDCCELGQGDGEKEEGPACSSIFENSIIDLRKNFNPRTGNNAKYDPLITLHFIFDSLCARNTFSKSSFVTCPFK